MHGGKAEASKDSTLKNKLFFPTTPNPQVLLLTSSHCHYFVCLSRDILFAYKHIGRFLSPWLFPTNIISYSAHCSEPWFYYLTMCPDILSIDVWIDSPRYLYWLYGLLLFHIFLKALSSYTHRGSHEHRLVRKMVLPQIPGSKRTYVYSVAKRCQTGPQTGVWV